MSPGGSGRIWGAAGLRLAAADAAIFAALLVASFLPLLRHDARGEGVASRITTAAGEARELDLARDGVTAVAGALGETMVEVRGGRARILSSPCPRQLCRHGGWVGGGTGGLLVCVPNGVAVRVAGPRPGGVDARAR